MFLIRLKGWKLDGSDLRFGLGTDYKPEADDLPLGYCTAYKQQGERQRVVYVSPDDQCFLQKTEAWAIIRLGAATVFGIQEL